MKRKRPYLALLSLLILALMLTSAVGCGPKVEPVPQPAESSTTAPTAAPAPTATVVPTAEPTPEPTAEPTAEPTPEPTSEPTPEPTAIPGPGGDSGEKPVPQPTENEDGSITVYNVTQLLNALAPGRDIVLAGGVYNISTFYNSFNAEPSGEYWYFNWGGLTLCGLTGLTLRSMEGETVELVTEDAYANVLELAYCEYVDISGLTIGHYVEPGRCTGGVLEMTYCQNIHLDGLDLYGCGTYGLIADHTVGVYTENSVIRECSYGILNLVTCSGFDFARCAMRDCSGYEQLDMYYSSAKFTDCAFSGNGGLYGFLSNSNTNSILFDNCSFDVWEAEQLAEQTKTLGGVSFTDPGSPHSFNDVTVTNAAEFLEAVKPNTLIRFDLSEPMDLTAYLQEVWENDGQAWNDAHPYVQICECYQGLDLAIRNVNGLTLVGSFTDPGDTHIYVEPRYADVLRFENCANISLRGFTLGHTDTGECFGNVLSFEGCSNVRLNDLDLYGCGFYGLCFMNGSSDAYIHNCLIRECSAGPVYVEYCGGTFAFIDCDLVDSQGGGGFWGTENLEVYFLRCRFGYRETESLMYDSSVQADYCDWDPEAAGWYPDYEYELDPAQARPVPFDKGALADTYWVGWRFTDVNAEVTRDLPYTEPDGNTVQFILNFYDDGSGLLEGYEGRDIPFTWNCDSDYTALLELEELEDQGSVSLHYQEFESGNDGFTWLMLYLEDMYIWFY